ATATGPTPPPHRSLTPDRPTQAASPTDHGPSSRPDHPDTPHASPTSHASQRTRLFRAVLELPGDDSAAGPARADPADRAGAGRAHARRAPGRAGQRPGGRPGGPAAA